MISDGQKVPRGYLSPKQAARRLGVGTGLIQQYCARGHLKAKKINRYLWICPESLEEFRRLPKQSRFRKKKAHAFYANIHERVRHLNHENFIPHSCPAFPTDAQPGTPEKVEVLLARVEAGQELWHPKDPTIEWELADVLYVRTRSLAEMRPVETGGLLSR